MIDYDGTIGNLWKLILAYNRTISCSIGLFILGLLFAGNYAYEYIASDFQFNEVLSETAYLAVLGLMFIRNSALELKFLSLPLRSSMASTVFISLRTLRRIQVRLTTSRDSALSSASSPLARPPGQRRR